MDASIPDIPTPPESKTGSGDHSLCASLESVAVQGVAPEVGDSIKASVEGTVDSIEGDRAYFTVSKVNGQDVPASEESEPQNDEAGMLRKAEAADASAY